MPAIIGVGEVSQMSAQGQTVAGGLRLQAVPQLVTHLDRRRHTQSTLP